MRRSVLGLTAILLSGSLAAEAQAAPKFVAPLSQIFERVCLGSRPDFENALSGLEGAGYVEVTLPEDALKGIRKYESQVGEALWTVLVADRVDSKPPTPAPQRIRACTVSGPDAGLAETELRAWLGLPKAAEGEPTNVQFVETDGKRTIIPRTEASLAGAMKGGGFWTLVVAEAAGGKLAALVFASPAP